MHKQIEILARKHKDWVNIARSFGAKTEAEDIVQEMYIRLDRYIKPNQQITASFVWITLRNIYFDFLKKEPITTELNLTLSEELLDINSIFAYERLNESVISKLNECHWFDKMLFELYITSGKSMRQLAKETRISLSCIFETISKVRSYLKEELKEEYILWQKEKQLD